MDIPLALNDIGAQQDLYIILIISRNSLKY